MPPAIVHHSIATQSAVLLGLLGQQDASAQMGMQAQFAVPQMTAEQVLELHRIQTEMAAKQVREWRRAQVEGLRTKAEDAIAKMFFWRELRPVLWIVADVALSRLAKQLEEVTDEIERWVETAKTDTTA